MAEEKGVWRTVRGRRVFIREGEDLYTAMKNSGKFNNIKDIEHQKRKINNDIQKHVFTNEKDRKEKWEEYDTFDKLSRRRTIKNSSLYNNSKTYNEPTNNLEGKHIKPSAQELQRLKNQEESMLNAYANNRSGYGQNYWLEKYKEATKYRKEAEEKVARYKEQKIQDYKNKKGNVDENSNEIKNNKVEYITKEEYDKMPKDYKGTLKELVDTARFRGENADTLRKEYEAKGYDVDKDKTILRLENGGTVLKPVKIKEEMYTRTSKSDEEYELYKKAKINPDSIDPMTENSTDWEALNKKYASRYNEEIENKIRKKAITADQESELESSKRIINDIKNQKIDRINTKAEIELNKEGQRILQKPTVADVRKKLRNMENWNEEVQYGNMVITKTGHTGYHIRNVKDEDDPMTDYFAGVYGVKEKQILNMLQDRGFIEKQEIKGKVERYRERKGTIRTNKTPTKRELAEKLIDNQIKRGIVRQSSREMLIKNRLNTMSKEELEKALGYYD